MDNVHLVLNEDDGGPVISRIHADDFIHETLGLIKGHARARLVKEQKPGLRHEGAHDFHTPPVEHAELGNGMIKFLSEAGVQGFELFRRLFTAGAVLGEKGLSPEDIVHETEAEARMVADHDVVEDGEIGTEPGALEGAGDTRPAHFLRRGAGDVAAVHHDAARARAVNACHHVKEGCLAGAVGTDKPHGLAGVDVHLQRVQGHETAEAHGEIRAFKQMCHYALPVYVRGLRGRSPAGR